MSNPNPKTLVTGASGMLGLELCRVLTEKDYQIYKDRFDISDLSEIDDLAKNNPDIDSIIHCAAVTDVNKCEQEKNLCSSVNVTGTKNIVDLARRLNSELIYISTPMVFSGQEGDYREDSPTQPINYYGTTKRDAEIEILKYEKGLVLRVNPIGIRPVGVHPSFIQWFFEAAKNNKSFNLFTDVRINPISTTTLSGIISELIVNFQPGILHLGSVDISNKAEIWDLIASKFPDFSGHVIRSNVGESSAGKIAARPQEMWLNTDRAQKLGFKMPNWREEVNTVLKNLGI